MSFQIVPLNILCSGSDPKIVYLIGGGQDKQPIMFDMDKLEFISNHSMKFEKDILGDRIVQPALIQNNHMVLVGTRHI